MRTNPFNERIFRAHFDEWWEFMDRNSEQNWEVYLSSFVMLKQTNKNNEEKEYKYFNNPSIISY